MLPADVIQSDLYSFDLCSSFSCCLTLIAVLGMNETVKSEPKMMCTEFQRVPNLQLNKFVNRS
jgi:hypothetical protein